MKDTMKSIYILILSQLARLAEKYVGIIQLSVFIIVCGVLLGQMMSGNLRHTCC